MADEEIRRCCACRQHKPLVDFNRNQFNCRVCAKAKYRQWRIENREHHAQRNNRWYYGNQSIVSARMKLYRERNAEKLAAAKRIDYERDPEKIKARVRAWAKANPERCLVYSERRRALKLSLPADWNGTDVLFGLEYWDNACATCCTPFGLIAKVCWDHWIPLVNPACPGTVPGNMLPLCMFCNSTKQDRPAAKWLNERFPKQADRILRRVTKFFAATRKD